MASLTSRGQDSHSELRTLLFAPLRLSRLQILVLTHSFISFLGFIVSVFFGSFMASIDRSVSFTDPVRTFPELPQPVFRENTPWLCLQPGLFVTRQRKASLSSLRLFNLLFPVYFLPAHFSFSHLCVLMCRRSGGEENFVLSCEAAAVEKKKGGERPLCVNLLARGHVMSVKGIKTYHQTNLSVTPTTVLRSILHSLPPPHPSLPPHPFTFPLMCLLSEGRGSRRQRGIAPRRLAARVCL